MTIADTYVSCMSIKPISKHEKRTLRINDINIFPKWVPTLVQREMISGQTFGGGRRRCCLQCLLLGGLGQGWERQL